MQRIRAAGGPSLPYVAPFAVFVLLLVLGPALPPVVDAPLRVAVLGLVLWVFSRQIIRFKANYALPSAALGIMVFFLWIAPDVLFPHYRDSWVFQNFATGRIRQSIPAAQLAGGWILCLRIFRSVALVPIIEELFWRAWLMRWLISPRFEKVALGSYTVFSFWISALLFGSEHGPYWDVGLAAGVIYNWWMVRTRSLGDCILAHAVTNACLAGYVVATHRWEYWL